MRLRHHKTTNIVLDQKKHVRERRMGASSSHIGLAHTVRNADECVDALSRALEAMEPPLDVYEGILRTIAEFTPYGELPHILFRSSLFSERFARSFKNRCDLWCFFNK